MKELNFTQSDGFYVAEVGTNGEPIAVQVNRKILPYPQDGTLEVLGRIDPSMPWAPVQMFDYKSPRNIIVYQNIPVDGYQLKLRSRTEVESAGYIGEGYSPWQELYVPTSIGGDTNPVLDEGVYHAYYVVKTQTQNRTAKLMKDGVEVAGGATVAASLSSITEQTIEAIPELAEYLGWKYDVVAVNAEGLSDGAYSIEYAVDGLSDDSLTFEVEDTPDYLCFTAEEEGAKMSFIGLRSPDKSFDLPDLKYSTDKKNWTALTYTEGEEDENGNIPFSSQIITLGLGKKVYFKGLNPNGVSRTNMDTFSMLFSEFKISEGAIAASGDIGTITDEIGGADCVLTFGCYQTLFSECTALTSAPTLPATTLAAECYSSMFYDCTFPMSNDGTAFNFSFGATLPQTVGGWSLSSYKDVANWMGNTTGFN